MESIAILTYSIWGVKKFQASNINIFGLFNGTRRKTSPPFNVKKKNIFGLLIINAMHTVVHVCTEICQIKIAIIYACSSKYVHRDITKPIFFSDQNLENFQGWQSSLAQLESQLLLHSPPASSQHWHIIPSDWSTFMYPGETVI